MVAFGYWSPDPGSGGYGRSESDLKWRPRDGAGVSARRLARLREGLPHARTIARWRCGKAPLHAGRSCQGRERARWMVLLLVASGCSVTSLANGSPAPSVASRSASFSAPFPAPTSASFSAPTSAPFRAQSSGPFAVSSPPPACSMSLTSDPYDGFHIGVPTGWDLSTLNGSIFVSRNRTSTEVAVVSPGRSCRMEKPPHRSLNSPGEYQAQVAGAGLTLTYALTSLGAQSPTASLSVQSGRRARSTARRGSRSCPM